MSSENKKNIDLGCGKNCSEGYIGIDIMKVPGVDIVHDLNKGIPLEDNSVDKVRAFDILEHIEAKNVIHLMNEIWRVLVPNGKFYFKVPDAEKGQGAWQDPTHRSFWVKNSFKYYENDYYHELYGIKAKFKIEELESIEYDLEYWGKNWAIMGLLTAIK